MLCEAFWKASGLAGATQDDYLKYERASAAFARFCKSDTTTSIIAMLGEPAISAYSAAAAQSRANKLERTGTYWLGAGLTALALYIATRPMPRAISAATAMPAGLLVGRAMRIGHRTDEPRLETLICEAPQAHRDNILRLDEFCRRAASGSFGIVDRHPDGSIRPIDDDMLKCFSADGGKLLVLSDDPADWLAIRRRPVPRGEILIDIRSAVASNLLTSETLIHMADEEMFEAKFQWLLARARGDDQTSRSFRHQLNLINAFRHPAILALDKLKDKEDALEKEGFGRTVAHRMHSGNYEPFQNFLKTLPLHELP
jgi:hypothetical protein